MTRLDPRSVIGVASFVLVLVVFGLILLDKSLLKEDAFLILATAIVITGWVNGPVSWAYSATKTGGELAEVNAKLVQDTATEPKRVTVDQPPDKPIPTTDAPVPAPAPATERTFAWSKS